MCVSGIKTRLLMSKISMLTELKKLDAKTVCGFGIEKLDSWTPVLGVEMV